MKYFTVSFIIAVLGLAGAYLWAGLPGLFICALLTLMEISFSFDNAVVNATVLKGMDHLWRKRFLTWGMVVAVFGVRFIFPLMIVAFATGMPMWDVGMLAFDRPEEYSAHVLASHVQIGAFGGMFLLMVFLHFILNEKKELHWIEMIERKLAQMGKLESLEVIVALGLLLVVQGFLHEEEKLPAMISGVVGVALYVAINSITALVGHADKSKASQQTVAYSGIVGFIYLQFLDASFSLDGVIGAFAISKDVAIIMIGLGVGAMFVRSLTVYLVEKGTLDQYLFLEHGAHYGIGALAAIMLISMVMPVSEIITGLIGITFILLSLYSSVKYNRRK